MPAWRATQRLHDKWLSRFLGFRGDGLSISLDAFEGKHKLDFQQKELEARGRGRKLAESHRMY